MHRSLTIAPLLLAITAQIPASAESYCVACYGPDAVYRCIVADTPADGSPDPRNQVQCIKQLAQTGGHARCSVERFSTGGCNGAEHVIQTARGLAPAAASPAPSEARTQPSPAAEDPATASTAGTSQPPRTVEEMAKGTVESTKRGIDDVTGTVKSSTEKAGEQIGGVGSAIGTAAKKSWHCVSSLFNDC
jgi:hypothetical protein